MSFSCQQVFTEPGCFNTTLERKFYRRGGAFIKRSLRRREYRTTQGYQIHFPRLNNERLMNEAASLRYVRANTDIPVPELYCDFEDDGAYYLIMEHVGGVEMSTLSDASKAVVEKELEQHLAKLKTLRWNRIGGPSGIVIPPFRVLVKTEINTWSLQSSDQDEYVFCHNSLSQHDVIVDPVSLKINAIVDWEYAGFYPSRFDWPFYKRSGDWHPSKGEDDTTDLLEFLKSKNVCYSLAVQLWLLF